MAKAAAYDGLSYFAQDLKLSCFPNVQWEDSKSSLAILMSFLEVMDNHFPLEEQQMLSMSSAVCLRYLGSCPCMSY